mgnify:CR=1 FL=1
MARRVTWTEPALEDLEAVAAYIARDSPRYAAAVVREAQEAARSLERFSHRGRVVPELDEPAVREIFVRKFRLIYEVRGEEIFVLGFIHGARDLGELWDRPRPK